MLNYCRFAYFYQYEIDEARQWAAEVRGNPRCSGGASCDQVDFAIKKVFLRT